MHRRAMWRAQGSGDIGPGAKAGIDQALPAQLVQRGGIVISSSRLDQRHGIGRNAQPREILVDRVDELGTTAARIEILDPEQEPIPPRPRKHR